MGQGLHIALTGASGFVGHALVHRLVAQGHRVTSLVREAASAPPGSSVLVHALGSGAELILPRGIDAVAHLAQSRAFRAFPGDTEEMYRVNVTGAHELLNAAAQARVSRFCMVSSGTVYEPFKAVLREDAALFPASNLGATKLAAEVLAKPYGALFPLSILRVFSPYGPGQKDRLIPDLIRRVSEGLAVTLPMDGGGMRFAPTFVDDLCEVMIMALADSWTGTFNVASPEVLSVEDVARGIGAALGREPRFERKEMTAPTLVPSLSRLGGQYDLSRFRSFTDGIAATVVDKR